ncbi:DNA ligase 3 [Cylas formicarius]|uniref:DNA ligase 3 n=1 Tax=Cylas formicarius TaxID=197179 RepID=UPI002958AD9F|nr:DNA ligase 3 [Cylas formicarius]XP_060525175.1 DNA ligase 3 [Cylas formicarius]
MSDSEQDDKQFQIEISKNGRAGCKKCKQKCLQGDIRIAKIVPNPFGEGKMKSWHHLDCLFDVFKKQRASTKRIETADDISGFETLSSEDKDLVQKKIKEIRQFFGIADNTSPTKIKKSPKIKQDSGNSPKGNAVNTDISRDNLFKTFQHIVSLVAQNSSYLDKTEIIRKFFEKGTNKQGFNGDIEIWCRLLLPQSVKRIYNLQSKQLIKLFSKMFLEDQDEMLEHLEQGDVSETVSHFYSHSKKWKHSPKDSTITVQNVDTFLEYLSKLTKEEDQINHFEKILPKLTSNDLKTIIRLVKHDLRMGAGAKHILDGIHPDAYEAYKASKDLDDVVARCFGSKKIQNAEIKILTPVFPMLAEPCKSVQQAMQKCVNGMYSEVKYDGERVQVHKQGKEFRYFSRSLKPVMPHKVSHFKDYIPKAFPNANDLILDAEILMMDTNTGKPLPFGTLGIHKKAQFKDATVCLFVFDCIYYNGRSLLKEPLRERKSILNANMTEVPNHIVFSEMKEINDSDTLAKMIAKVLKLGLEGLVLKDVMSTYEPGKRHWLKVKKDYLFDGAMADSADLIVLGAWYGTGKKGGMMSVFLMGCYDPYSETFRTVTKVHGGHDDKTLEKLQTELKMQKISCDVDRLPDWLSCTRTMVPDFVAADPKEMPVWEITGAEFTRHDVHTADGISIRFPRVTKIRDDKDWKTATNLEELKSLFKKSKEETDVTLLMKGVKRKSSEDDEDNHSGASTKTNESIGSSRGSPSKKQKNKKKSRTSKSSEGHRSTRGVKINEPLPDLFKGIKGFFVDNYNNEFKRYFIAFGGTEVGADHRQEAEYVFHVASCVGDLSRSCSKVARNIHVSWIVDSVNKMKLQNICHYIVKWSPIVSDSDKLIFKSTKD